MGSADPCYHRVTSGLPSGSSTIKLPNTSSLASASRVARGVAGSRYAALTVSCIVKVGAWPNGVLPSDSGYATSGERYGWVEGNSEASGVFELRDVGVDRREVCDLARVRPVGGSKLASPLCFQ